MLITDGCLAWRAGERYECDAYQVRVVDSTGAGDAFVGALGVALARGQSLARALPVAATTGALACRTFGAQQPELAWADVVELMRSQPVRVRGDGIGSPA